MTAIRAVSHGEDKHKLLRRCSLDVLPKAWRMQKSRAGLARMQYLGTFQVRASHGQTGGTYAGE
jgi:hypothetical protein